MYSRQQNDMCVYTLIIIKYLAQFMWHGISLTVDRISEFMVFSTELTFSNETSL